MNKTDFSKRFFTVCCGVSITILSVAALLYATKPATASGVPQSNFVTPAPAAGSGKYVMQYDVGQAQNGSFYWQVFAYNSETGSYKAFYWDSDAQGWVENFASSKALPGLP